MIRLGFENMYCDRMYLKMDRTISFCMSLMQRDKDPTKLFPDIKKEHIS
jgi:hypothetical protein